MARAYQIGGRLGGYVTETGAWAYAASAGYSVETSGSGGGLAYTLTVNAGAVTAAGSAVVLRFARNVAVQAAAVTVSGASVNLRFGRSVVVGTSAATVAGSSITLTFTHLGNYVLNVNPGSVMLTGSPVTLTYSGALSVIEDMPFPPLAAPIGTLYHSPLEPRGAWGF